MLPPLSPAPGPRSITQSACKNDIGIMFNNHQRVLLQQQFFKTPDQLQDIFKMKTGCRFIKNEEGVFNIRPGNETCKLQPLGLTTRQRARRLAEPYVSKADLVKNRKFLEMFFSVRKKSIASRTVRSRTSAIDSPRYFASRVSGL